MFALLGYENGLLIKGYLEDKNRIDDPKLIGPRGSLQVNTETRRTIFEQFLLELSFIDGVYHKRIKEKVGMFNHQLQSCEKESNNGWFNAYLCH